MASAPGAPVHDARLSAEVQSVDRRLGFRHAAELQPGLLLLGRHEAPHRPHRPRCCSLYLVLHLAGNALIFAGPELFNEYSHALISNPLIIPIEIGLLLVFLLHVYKTVRMWMQNQRGAAGPAISKKELGRPHQPQEPRRRRR